MHPNELSDSEWEAGAIVLPTDDPWLAHKEAEYFRDTVRELDATGLCHLFQEGSAIERGQELRYVPRKVFQHYIQFFIGYLQSDMSTGDSDSPSVFISLVKDRERRDPGCVTEIMDSISPCLDAIAKSQSRYEADEDIYGNFAEQVATAKACLSSS